MPKTDFQRLVKFPRYPFLFAIVKKKINMYLIQKFSGDIVGVFMIHVIPTIVHQLQMWRWSIFTVRNVGDNIKPWFVIKQRVRGYVRDKKVGTWMSDVTFGQKPRDCVLVRTIKLLRGFFAHWLRYHVPPPPGCTLTLFGNPGHAITRSDLTECWLGNSIDLRADKALPKKGGRRSLVDKRRPRGIFFPFFLLITAHAALAARRAEHPLLAK
jgi:hypothetical protein